MREREIKKYCIVAFFAFFSSLAFSDAFSLTDFQVITLATLPETDESPRIPTLGTLSGRFTPISFLRAEAGISLYTDDALRFLHPAPELNRPGTVAFNGASLKTSEIQDTGVCLAAFTGSFDDPSSGTLLRQTLKFDLTKPEFYDMPLGRSIAPQTSITGTGIGATLRRETGHDAFGGYCYWNTLMDDEAKMEGDVRVGTVGDYLALNAFGGLSLAFSRLKGTWRGAITSLFTAPSGNELYAELGARESEFSAADTRGNLYFVFEPRVYFESFDLSALFFSAPIESDENYLGGNLLFGIGNVSRNRFRGGIGVFGSFDPKKPQAVTPFSFSISPFCCMMVSDLLFNVTVVINPLTLDEPETMGELQLSVKAVF
jgi:hypothetical protein